MTRKISNTDWMTFELNPCAFFSLDCAVTRCLACSDFAYQALGIQKINEILDSNEIKKL